MKKGIASAERNTKPSITMVIKTRTPLEAFQMLRMGQPIDTMAAYYDDKELLDKDFWMMDKTEKLHHLADLKKLESDLDRNITFYQDEIKTNHINKLNEQNAEIAKQSTPSSGPVPESGTK